MRQRRITFVRGVLTWIGTFLVAGGAVGVLSSSSCHVHYDSHDHNDGGHDDRHDDDGTPGPGDSGPGTRPLARPAGSLLRAGPALAFAAAQPAGVAAVEPVVAALLGGRLMDYRVEWAEPGAPGSVRALWDIRGVRLPHDVGLEEEEVDEAVLAHFALRVLTINQDILGWPAADGGFGLQSLVWGAAEVRVVFRRVGSDPGPGVALVFDDLGALVRMENLAPGG